MAHNPFAPDFEDLPPDLPIFPLEGVLLLPYGQLPLNIFEPRYLTMVDDVMASDRLIGIVQPKDKEGKVYETACAGKITEYSETDDGRYLITLTGVCRFKIKDDLLTEKGYRKANADWSAFKTDLESNASVDIDRTRFMDLLRKYFEKEGMTCDWKAVDDSPDGKLITCLSMVCPFEAGEKQALLEAPCGRTRADMFMTMLEMAVCSDQTCESKH